MIAFVLKIIIFVKLISAGKKIKNRNINDANNVKGSTNQHSYDEIDEYFGDLIDFDLEIDPKADFEEALLEFLETELQMEEDDDEQYRPGDKKMHIFEEKLKENINESMKEDVSNKNEAEYVRPDDFMTGKLQKYNIIYEKENNIINKSQEMMTHQNLSSNEQVDGSKSGLKDYYHDQNNNFN